MIRNVVNIILHTLSYLADSQVDGDLELRPVEGCAVCMP